MAAPATHIIFAEKFLDNNPSLSRKEFILGTSFPDIRYLGVIQREETHLSPITPELLHDVARPFMAGVAFHNHIDLLRKSYWEDSGLLTDLPQSPYISQALKVYEDMILYDNCTNWSEIGGYFNTVLDEEVDFNISSANIARWHKMLQAYLASKPDPTRVTGLFSAFGFEQSAVDSVGQTLRHLMLRPELPDEITTMYEAVSARQVL